MPSSYETLPIRAWLQGSHVQPAAATVRLTLDPSGTPATHDWLVTAGTRWASVDAMLDAWNTALAGAATVSRYTNSYTHRSSLKVVTSGAVAYQVAWSHAGDGSAIRDRLGLPGNIATTSSGTVHGYDVVGDVVSWVGARGLVRGATSYRSSSVIMASGAVETQASGDRDDVVTLSCDFGLGAPDGAPGLWLGLRAFDAWLDALWGQAWCLDDVWTLAAAADGNTVERWQVRFAGPTIDIRPEQPAGALPQRLWRVPLDLVVESAP